MSPFMLFFPFFPLCQLIWYQFRYLTHKLGNNIRVHGTRMLYLTQGIRIFLTLTQIQKIDMDNEMEMEMFLGLPQNRLSDLIYKDCIENQASQTIFV